MNASKTVLVVEDDDILRDTYVDILVFNGFSVISAKDGADGVVKYIEFNPEIVFMDVKMPKLDGYDAFSEIKEYDKDAKVIFVSGNIREDEQKLKRIQHDGDLIIIEKPIEPKQLLSIAQSLLD